MLNKDRETGCPKLSEQCGQFTDNWITFITFYVSWAGNKHKGCTENIAKMGITLLLTDIQWAE